MYWQREEISFLASCGQVAIQIGVVVAAHLNKFYQVIQVLFEVYDILCCVECWEGEDRYTRFSKIVSSISMHTSDRSMIIRIIATYAGQED